jgi:hypothetical protein
LSQTVTVGVLNVNRRHDRPPFTAEDLESVAQLARSAEGVLARQSSESPAVTGGSEG